MSWLQKLFPFSIRTQASKKKDLPEGLWTKCASCNAILYRAELERNFDVCPKCSHHHRMSARKRINSFLDPDTFTEFASEVQAVDRLKFKDSKKYKDRITAAQKKTGETEAIIVGHGKLDALPIVLAVFEFNFIGGSMSSAVGEKFVRAVDYAVEHLQPFVCFSASGGARMQEGLFSLMQMAKTSAALARLSQFRMPFISVLTDPTMGGVSASFATLGDIIIAEPNALVGFAGPRVIEQTVRQTLPSGFQRSEFLLDHGHVDMIVDRQDMRTVIVRLLRNLTSSSA